MSMQPLNDNSVELGEISQLRQESASTANNQQLNIEEVDDNFNQKPTKKVEDRQKSNQFKKKISRLIEINVNNDDDQVQNKLIDDEKNKTKNDDDKEDEEGSKGGSEIKKAFDLYKNFLDQQDKDILKIQKIDDKTTFFGIDKYKNVIYYTEESQKLKIASVRKFDYEPSQIKKTDGTGRPEETQINSEDDALFNEKEVKLESKDESVTTLTVDNQSEQVYLGTDKGNIYIHSSTDFQQKAIKKTNKLCSVLQILVSQEQCFVLLSNFKIVKFATKIDNIEPTEINHDDKLKEKYKEKEIEYLAFKLSNNKEFLATCCRVKECIKKESLKQQKEVKKKESQEKQKKNQKNNNAQKKSQQKDQKEEQMLGSFLKKATSFFLDIDGQPQEKGPEYSIIIFHLGQSDNQKKRHDDHDVQNHQEKQVKLEKFNGHYRNVKLHEHELESNELFKLIPDWLCFSQNDDSIFIRQELVHIKELFLEKCALKREQKKIYQSGMYISKIQSFKDENIIVCSGKEQNSINNIHIVDLLKKTNTTLKTDSVIQDFAVTKDQEWIFTMEFSDKNNEKSTLEFINLNSQKYHLIGYVSNKNQIIISQDHRGKDVIMYLHDSFSQETSFYQLENLDKIQDEDYCIFEDQRYSLVDYYQKKCRLDRKYQIPAQQYENFEIEFIDEQYIYAKRKLEYKYQIIRINTKKNGSYDEEVICEPNETGHLIFKITSDNKYLFYQTRNGLFQVEIKTKKLKYQLQMKVKENDNFQFQFQGDDNFIFAFFYNEGIKVEYSDSKDMIILNHKSADNDLEVEKIGIFNKENQFMILNSKNQKSQKDQDDLQKYKKGLRILDLKDFKFIEINKQQQVYDFQVLKGGEFVLINKEILFQVIQNELAQVIKFSNQNIVYKFGKNKELQNIIIDDKSYPADESFIQEFEQDQLNKLQIDINFNQI